MKFPWKKQKPVPAELTADWLVAAYNFRATVKYGLGDDDRESLLSLLHDARGLLGEAVAFREAFSSLFNGEVAVTRDKDGSGWTLSICTVVDAEQLGDLGEAGLLWR